jgi:hypothetical protein
VQSGIIKIYYKNESLDSQQFHQYQQNEQPSLTTYEALVKFDLIWLETWCLTPLSAIFQLYHCDQL